MPTYDYLCKDCGHQFEKFQSIKAPRLTDCPECDGDLKRLIGTGGAILFKGAGFYETDYRSSGYQEKAKAESDSNTPSESNETTTNAA